MSFSVAGGSPLAGALPGPEFGTDFWDLTLEPGRAAWDRRTPGPGVRPFFFGWLLRTVRKSWFRERVAAFFELRDGLRQQGGRFAPVFFGTTEVVP